MELTARLALRAGSHEGVGCLVSVQYGTATSTVIELGMRYVLRDGKQVIQLGKRYVIRVGGQAAVFGGIS